MTTPAVESHYCISSFNHVILGAMEKTIIYTDGSSRGNPGSGGYGAILVNGSKVKEIGGREKNTTNNRMEMKAVIEALKEVSKSPIDSLVEIHTDSEYLMKGATLWIKNWQKNNWRTKNKKPVLNQDLWQEILLLSENRKISWQKVLGHSGHKYNDRCDQIATSFADGKKVNLYDGESGNYKI